MLKPVQFESSESPDSYEFETDIVKLNIWLMYLAVSSDVVCIKMV